MAVSFCITLHPSSFQDLWWDWGERAAQNAHGGANKMPEDLGKDQLFPEPTPLPPDSSLIPGHHVLEVCMLGSTIPTLGPLSSPPYSKCVWPANHSWHQWGLQNHPHLCFILLLARLFILSLFSIYWAPVGTVWKSCLHLIPGRVCICTDFSVQLVSFTKSGFELESRCYSQPFLKAVSQVRREGPTSPKKSYIPLQSKLKT